jgi:hypothetical protein
MELGQDRSKLRGWFLAAMNLSQRFSFSLIKWRSNVVGVFMVYVSTTQMRLSGSVLRVTPGDKLET